MFIFFCLVRSLEKIIQLKLLQFALLGIVYIIVNIKLHSIHSFSISARFDLIS